MTKTYVSGKDAPLEDTIKKMQRLLKHHGFNIKESKWLNPLPHVWSVHIRDYDCPELNTNGKGNTKKAALASALGEFFERLATNFFFADYWLGKEISEMDFVHFPDERWLPLTTKTDNESNFESANKSAIKQYSEFDNRPDKKLDKKLNMELLDQFTRNFYNPDDELSNEMLVDLNSCNIKKGVCALPFTRIKDGKKVLFPVNILDNLYVSNGMAAGNTMDEAVVQALSEIIERSIKNKIISKGISLPDIPASVIDNSPEIKTGIKTLEQQGFNLFIKDASLGGRYPLVNITMVNQKKGGCYAAFGAHPEMGVALMRCFTELLQGREVNNLDLFPPPSLDLEKTSDPQNLESHFIDSSGILPWQMIKDKPDFPFTDWSFKGSNREMKKYLLNLLLKENHQVYIAEYDHLGIDVCRIVVPGFSEIYPVDDLYWNNNNQAIYLQKSFFPLKNLDKKEIKELSNKLSEGELSDILPVASLLGLPQENGTIWQDLYLPEIKTHLYLALGEHENAMHEIENLIFSGYLQEKRSKLYFCLLTLVKMTMGNIDASDYKTALTSYFSKKDLNLCQNMVDGEMLEGKSLFHDFENIADLKNLKSHQALIRAYDKVQKAKKA